MKKLLVALGVAALSTGAMAQNVGSSVFYNADNGHYYQMYFNAAGLSWNDASTEANSRGGYLATLTSKSENDFVVSNIMPLFTPNPPPPGNVSPGLYLGGSDNDTEGTWTWVTGETWAYTNWNFAEPNNASLLDSIYDQDYLQIVKYGYAGFSDNWDDCWGDPIVANSNGFIVEWNSNPTAPGNNAVPEPSEWAAMGLLGTGLLGLVVRGRKKKLAN